MVWLSSMISWLITDQWSVDHMIHVQADFLQITFAIQMNLMNEWTEVIYLNLIGIIVTLILTYLNLERTSNLTKLEQDFAWQTANSNTKVLYFMLHFSLSYRWMKILWNCSLIHMVLTYVQLIKFIKKYDTCIMNTSLLWIPALENYFSDGYITRTILKHLIFNRTLFDMVQWLILIAF